MRKITRITNLLLFLLVIPLSYSITLEELINFYNYSYSLGQINITDIIHYGNDTDGNLLYDYLIINITLDNDEGNYTFIGDLYIDDDLITTISDTDYLYDGQNTIPLYYNAKLLQNGIYNLSLTIQEDYLTVYREDDVYSFDFDNTFYEKPDISVGIDGYELINNDADAKYEFLRINTTINSSIDGIFEINALIANSKTINSKDNHSLTNGTNNISIDFDGKEIRRNRINNSRLYLITIRNGINYEFDFNYSLIYDLYELDAEQSILIDSYSDGKVDLNDNNLSEFLEINISLDINESGVYEIELELDDLYYNYVRQAAEEFSLNKGEQIVSFRINGTDIYNSKVNGPYLVEYVKLGKDNLTLDVVSKPYITNYYNYDEFERPLMPDLVIESLEVENATNVKINLANEGGSYAFAFNVNLFDDNFNSIEESLIDYLASGDSREVGYNVNTSNTSKLYAIVDYDNSIEENNESNNLLVYELNKPPALEFIGNITVNETGLVMIIVNATDPNGDNLSYYTNDSRFDRINDTFIWQTPDGSAGIYAVNITVSDYEFNVSQLSTITVNDVCIPNWIEINTSCKPDNTIIGWYNDTNNCYAITGLESDNNPPENNTYSCQYPLRYNITLKLGWNLISFPLNLTNKTLPKPLESIEGNYSKFLTYYDGLWIELQDNDSIDYGRGYWINMANNDILELLGEEFDDFFDYSPKDGWDLVSYNIFDINQLNESISELIRQQNMTLLISTYENGEWLTYSSDRPFNLNTLVNLTPGYGYWIKINVR